MPRDNSTALYGSTAARAAARAKGLIMKCLAMATRFGQPVAVGNASKCGRDACGGQGARSAHLRRKRHAGGLWHARSARQLDRLRCRFLPRLGGGDFQRSGQGEIRAVDRQGSLHRPAIGRSGRALAQHDVDVVARHFARARFSRGDLLRRPGFYGAQSSEGEFGAGTRWRHDLRPAGHHHRA